VRHWAYRAPEGREPRSPMSPVIPTRIIPSAAPADLSPRRVEKEFNALLESGAKILPAGRAKNRPRSLLTAGYVPRFRIDLFDTRYYLTKIRQIPELTFMVAYVAQSHRSTGKTEIYPRIFYKDLSLIWRSASHLVNTGGELWIGKGDIGSMKDGDEEIWYSIESTTDLPLEIQTALEMVMRGVRRIPPDGKTLPLVLRNAPNSRMEPYADFTAPRRRAASNPRNLINRGKSVARFRRNDDPGSLEFTAGFEPDFRRGIIDRAETKSGMYGGIVERYRILSVNKKIQYMFMAGPNQVWIIPPQALTTDISTYGVRTIDVVADEDLFVPGFEYHYMDDEVDPPAMFSQIPDGYAGAPSVHDEARADASAWLDALPVVKEFRRKVLGRKSSKQA